MTVTTHQTQRGGEQALWRAVILQAILDACSNSGRTEDQLAKRDAKEWLLSNSNDFKQVAHLAGMAPDYARRRALCAIENSKQWRRE